MLQLLQKVRDAIRSPYEPNPQRRDEVARFLSQRPALTHEEWHRRFAPDIPLNFVCWFRDTCSKYFEYDLSAALPDDRLVEDLGLFDATWGDVDWDILEDYGSKFRAEIPSKEQQHIVTFGAFLRALWSHAHKTPPNN